MGKGEFIVMRDSNFTINIIAVVYYRDDSQEEDPRYVQLDAEVVDSEIRRATFYLPYDKFTLKQIKKRCPWVYSYGRRKDIDLDLEILLEDFLDRPDLDPVYERIILNELPPDFDNIYVEFRDGRSRLLTPKRVKHWPNVYEVC